MRLTLELIENRPQFINPLKERELDLRGQRIPVMENLSATRDQFDCIDLSNNDLRRLESATDLRRLKMLLLSNNKVSRVAAGAGARFPNLEWLILSNNAFTELSELDPLAAFKSLRCLSLVDNAVAKQPHYRAYVLSRVPWLKVLDYQKVKEQEVAQARAHYAQLHAGADPDALRVRNKRGREAEDSEAAGKRTADGGADRLTPEQSAAARAAIANASSLEEVARLERALRADNWAAIEAEIKRQAEGAPAVTAMDE